MCELPDQAVETVPGSKGRVHGLGTFSPPLSTQSGSLGQPSLGHSDWLLDQEVGHFLRIFYLIVVQRWGLESRLLTKCETVVISQS